MSVKLIEVRRLGEREGLARAMAGPDQSLLRFECDSDDAALDLRLWQAAPVDCIWSDFCAAVGRYTTSGGSIKSLVMFWNGTEWKLQSVTDPEGATQSTLLDVSCTKTPNRCTAVGAWKNSEGEQFTLAYRFNGVTTWTLQSTPNPSESAESVLQDVSCATETSCTAAGSWIGVGESNQTLAEKWNGTSWAIQGTSNPAGAAFSSLFGVSCRSTTCMGVGWSTDGSGVDTTLGEIRE